jgi:hypothetical protein
MRTTILYPKTSYLEGRAPRARGRRRVDVCGIAEPFHLLRDLSLSKRFRPPITENEIFAAQRFCSNTPPSRGRMHSAPRLKYGTRRSVSLQRALGRCRFVDTQPFCRNHSRVIGRVYTATVPATRPTRCGEAVGPNAPPALTFYIIFPVGIGSRENHVPEARNLSFWLGCPSEVAIVTIKAFGKNLHGK